MRRDSIVLAVLVTIALSVTALLKGYYPGVPSPVPDARWGVYFVGYLGGAAIVDDTVIVYTMTAPYDENGEVVGYDIDGGKEKWRHRASFFAIAGTASDATTARIVAGHVGERGFDVLDPNGKLVWSESSGDVVWTYENIIVSLSCPGSSSSMSSCELAGHPLADPRSQRSQPWRTSLDGVEVSRPSFVKSNPRLDTELVAHSSADQGRGGGVYLGRPVTHDWAARLFGLPLLDGSTGIVSAADGKVLRIVPYERATTTYVTADQVLHMTVTPSGAGCRGALRAENGSGTKVLWQADPAYDFPPLLDQWGCQRPKAPLQGGANGVLAHLNGTRPVLLSVEDGRPYWIGADGVRVLATDGETVVVNGPGSRPIQVIETDQQVTTESIAIPETTNGAIVAGHVPIFRGRQWWALDRFDEPRDLGLDGEPIFASDRGLLVSSERHVWLIPR